MKRALIVSTIVVMALVGTSIMLVKVAYPYCITCSRQLGQWGIGNGPAPRTAALEPLPRGANIVFNETFATSGSEVMQNRVIVVADHTKFGRAGMIPVAPLCAAHVVVTDAGASPEHVEMLRGQGVEVLLA